jgi:hypothetical protein
MNFEEGIKIVQSVVGKGGWAAILVVFALYLLSRYRFSVMISIVFKNVQIYFTTQKRET